MAQTLVTKENITPRSVAVLVFNIEPCIDKIVFSVYS